MADWEPVVEFELENDFLLSRTTVTWLQTISVRLRKGGTTCNLAADYCDLAAEKIMTRTLKKIHKQSGGRHRNVSVSSSYARLMSLQRSGRS